MFGLMSVVCAATLLVNESKEKWIPFDMAMQTEARERCRKEYPDTPCLKKFIKKDIQVYWAICGSVEDDA